MQQIFLKSGSFTKGPAVMQLRDGPGRVTREINNVVGKSECVGYRIGRSVRMDKNGRFPVLQFPEQRLHAFVTQVNTLRVCKKYHSVQFENIESIDNFLDGIIYIRHRNTPK